ncbi:MAG: porin [Rhodocyclales bacterium]|nr:porin [Rhodocyclales bacterium]
MQKKLIAVAVAGLMSGAAFAQSNVTVYGAMDLTWESIKSSGATNGAIDDQKRTRLASNSSHIGFKGAETLGNGLTAVFQYETGFTADDAGALGGGRDTLIGVAGGFGTFAMGNLSGPVRTLGAKVDFNPGASSAGFTGAAYGMLGGVKTGTDERSKNAVAYISPNFGGATIIAAYQNGTPAADGMTVKKDSKAYTLGVTYAGGPVFVGVGYINAKNPTVANPAAKYLLTGSATTTDAAVDALLGAGTGAALTAANDKLTNFRVAGVVSLASGTSISALYDTQKYEASGIAEAKRAAMMFGVKQAFGANAVYGQYAFAKDIKGSICDIYTAVGSDCGSTGMKQFTVGFIHEMSKRTMVHAFYTKLSNEGNAGYDNYVNAVSIVGTGADNTVFGAGLRHTF